MTVKIDPDPLRRLGELEARVDTGFAVDARIRALEEQAKRRSSSTVRDWIQILGPYVSGVLVFVIGYWIKDSVTQAMHREQLNLDYVKDMRDLVKDFDEAQTQAAADANAVGLAMYGRHAVLPLVSGWIPGMWWESPQSEASSLSVRRIPRALVRDFWQFFRIAGAATVGRRIRLLCEWPRNPCAQRHCRFYMSIARPSQRRVPTS